MKHLFVAALVFIMSQGVFAATPVEGRDYIRIDPPVPVSTSGRIEVIDVFWYGCPHCYKFKSSLDPWTARKPDDVELVRLPGVLGASWRVHAQAYYAAESLGIAGDLHDAFFDAIHAQGRRLFSEGAIARFVEGRNLGVTAAEFSERMRSQSVKDKAKTAEILMRKYRVEGTPSVVVAGKYLVTARQSFESMMATVDALIAIERAHSAR